MHALAHSIGGLFDSHHGTLNAILMPYILVTNRAKIEKDIEYLSMCLGLKSTFEAFLDWILLLREELSIPHKLSEIGLSKKAAPIVGKKAEKDPSASTNPIILGANDYEKIYLRAISGDIS
jgi:alcohol dehydrogenase class IV